MAQGVKILI